MTSSLERVVGRLVAAAVLGGLLALLDGGVTLLVLASTAAVVPIERLANQKRRLLGLATLFVGLVAFAAFPLAALQVSFTRDVLSGTPRDAALAAVAKRFETIQGSGSQREVVFVLLCGVFATSAAFAFAIRSTSDRLDEHVDASPEGVTVALVAWLIGPVVTIAHASGLRPTSAVEDGLRLIAAWTLAFFAGCFVVTGIVLADKLGQWLVARFRRAP